MGNYKVKNRCTNISNIPSLILCFWTHVLSTRTLKRSNQIVVCSLCPYLGTFESVKKFRDFVFIRWRHVCIIDFKEKFKTCILWGLLLLTKYLPLCKHKCFFKWANNDLFFIYFVFSKNITIFASNKCEKMSIQYKVLGFEPTTFGTWVSSHNH